MRASNLLKRTPIKYIISGGSTHKKIPKALPRPDPVLSFLHIFLEKMPKSIGGSSGRQRRPPPLRDPILSFLPTFLPKSACIRGWRLLPPTGNPRSSPEYSRISEITIWPSIATSQYFRHKNNYSSTC